MPAHISDPLDRHAHVYGSGDAVAIYRVGVRVVSIWLLAGA
jgi:hypothetical protein